MSRSVDPFQAVAGTFKHADLLSVTFCVGCGHGRVAVDHVLPFSLKLSERCEVWLPWFNVVWIHRNGLLLISILVPQSGEAVAKFVHYHRLEHGVVGHGEVVRVENASTAILGRVYQHDNVLVRRACQQVVHGLEVEGGEVTVAVERVKVAA